MLFTYWLSYALVRASDYLRLELWKLEKKAEADSEADLEAALLMLLDANARYEVLYSLAILLEITANLSHLPCLATY
jgi:hypothetical protein